MSQAPFWLLTILAPIVSVVIDYLVIYAKLVIWPTPIDIAVEYDRGLYEPPKADDAGAAAPAAAQASQGSSRVAPADEEAGVAMGALKGAGSSSSNNGGGGGATAKTVADDGV